MVMEVGAALETMPVPERPACGYCARQSIAAEDNCGNRRPISSHFYKETVVISVISNFIISELPRHSTKALNNFGTIIFPFTEIQ